MDRLVPTEKYSPYLFFSAGEWAKFRADTPLTLGEDEIRRLRSLNDPVDLEEVRRIYLSMSRLLSAHVEASQLLFRQRQAFFNKQHVAKTPFIIGIAGSVALNLIDTESSARIAGGSHVTLTNGGAVSLTADGEGGATATAALEANKTASRANLSFMTVIYRDLADKTRAASR